MFIVEELIHCQGHPRVHDCICVLLASITVSIDDFCFLCAVSGTGNTVCHKLILVEENSWPFTAFSNIVRADFPKWSLAVLNNVTRWPNG